MKKQEINEPYNSNLESIPSPGDDDENPYGGIVTDVDYPLNVSKTQQQTPDPVFPSQQKGESIPKQVYCFV